jgi:hypothetical protein
MQPPVEEKVLKLELVHWRLGQEWASRPINRLIMGGFSQELISSCPRITYQIIQKIEGEALTKLPSTY